MAWTGVRTGKSGCTIRVAIEEVYGERVAGHQADPRPATPDPSFDEDQR